MRTAIVLAALTSLLPAACASTPPLPESDRLALYQAHAAAPVKDIRYTTPIGWEKVDRQHLLLTMRPNEAYLIEVSGPCMDWGGSSPTIRVNPTVGHLSAKLDTISTQESPVPCRIEEIRPVDTAAVHAAREAMSPG